MPRRFFAPVLLLSASLLLLGCPSNTQSSSVPSQTPIPSQAQLDDAVRSFDMKTLKRSLPLLPPGDERDYYTAIIEARQGHARASAATLTRLFPALRKNPARAAIALQTLADDEVLMGRYADAARWENLLVTQYRANAGQRLGGDSDDLRVWRILAGSPPQTVELHGATTLPIHRDPLGLMDAELIANGAHGRWLLDTGANLSLVSASYAKKLHLKPLPGASQTAGFTDAKNPLRVAILPELRFGSAILRNVVVEITPDAQLHFSIPGKDFTVQAIAGFPVLYALRSLTFHHSGSVTADGTPDVSGGALLYLDGLTPVLEGSVAGRPTGFTLDTGAMGTELNERFAPAFPALMRHAIDGSNITEGAGGSVHRKVKLVPKLAIGVGEREAVLHRVPVLIGTWSGMFNGFYGNLGQDFWAGSESFTIDFASMRFALGSPLPSP